MKYVWTLFSLIFISLTAKSQNAEILRITGQAVDQNEQPVPFANVALYRQSDSTLAKVGVSDTEGYFSIPLVTDAPVYLEISSVGMRTRIISGLSAKKPDRLALGTLAMASNAEELDEVTVTAERSVLEVKPDKLVFNVEESINAAGNNALELLRKSPGVIVDNNDQILLAGRAGVQIYINGRQSPYSGDDLSTFLRNLQSDQVEAIEVITNPSARFDAEGNGGIINIRLKKDKSLGANASLNLGSSAGRRPQYNGGINGNYRNRTVNVFGSYNYANRYNWNRFLMLRQQPGGEFDQRTITESHAVNNSFKLGTDVFLSEKSTVGFLFNGFTNDATGDARTTTSLAALPGATPDSLLLASTLSQYRRQNYNANLNYLWAGDNGRSWNIDLDYGWFRNQTEQELPNQYVGPNRETMLSREEYANVAPTNIDILTVKVDREQPLGAGTLEAGFKLAWVQTDNTFNWFDVEGGERIPDLDRTNRFRYLENVNAAYAAVRHPLGEKWQVQAGLRAEQTRTDSRLTAQKTTRNANVDSSYFNLFPSAGLTFQPNRSNTLRLNYSRRINRPNYQDLNPFEFQTDELSFSRGNPFLRPEFAHNLELSYTFKYRYTASLSYSLTNDLITRITDIGGEKSTFITWLNLAQQRNYSISLSAPVSFTDWWSSYSSVTGFRVENQADYGEGRIVDVARNTLNIYSQQTFTLGKDFKAEMSGWYQSPSVWGGTFETDAMYSINVGLQKELLDGQVNIRLSVNDIFFSSGWTANSVLGQLYQEGGGNWDSRRVQLNLRYRFGNQNVKKARDRSTGLQEQAKRVKSGN